MNRSYSKIRHIQESNQKLENRLLSEQPAPKIPDEVGYNTLTPLTDVMLILMKKAYLKYKGLGRNNLDKNRVKDNDVLQIQKYLNSTGTLGKGQKYDLLKENGIFDGDTFWQVNITLESKDRNWWLKNKY